MLEIRGLFTTEGNGFYGTGSLTGPGPVITGSASIQEGDGAFLGWGPGVTSSPFRSHCLWGWTWPPINEKPREGRAGFQMW